MMEDNSSVLVNDSYIESFLTGTVLGFQTEFYFGLVRKSGFNRWEFTDYDLSSKSVAELINQAILYEEGYWTEYVPKP